jgi:hypothetical protein
VNLSKSHAPGTPVVARSSVVSTTSPCAVSTMDVLEDNPAKDEVPDVADDDEEEEEEEQEEEEVDGTICARGRWHGINICWLIFISHTSGCG